MPLPSLNTDSPLSAMWVTDTSTSFAYSGAAVEMIIGAAGYHAVMTGGRAPSGAVVNDVWAIPFSTEAGTLVARVRCVWWRVVCMLCSDVWRCVAVCSGVWRCVAVCGGVWRCVAVFSCVWCWLDEISVARVSLAASRCEGCAALPVQESLSAAWYQ